MNNLLFVEITIILFLLNPFFTSILLLVIMYYRPLSNLQVNWSMGLVASFWGLLSYAQKSLADIGTDIIRYYNSLEMFESTSFARAIGEINVSEFINFVFYPASIIIVSLTREVQMIAFFWVFIVYYLAFLSIKKLLKYYNLYTPKRLVTIMMVAMLCFMCFTRISELLKMAPAIAVICYAIVVDITENKKLKTYFLTVISIGLHPTVLLLSPLIFLKRTDKRSILMLVLIFFIALAVNPVDIIESQSLGGGYLSSLNERYGNYGSNAVGSTPLYLAILFMLWSGTIWLWLHMHAYIKQPLTTCTVFSLITTLCIVNTTAFIRFTLFSHFFFILLMVMYYVRGMGKLNWTIKGIIVVMFVISIRYSHGRISEGGYASSYMNNSLTDIMLSTFFDYLSIDYAR